ncbi:MAG: hypothetical protein ACI837_000475, partial [Crocinitomicaceae bacterium]
MRTILLASALFCSAASFGQSINDTLFYTGNYDSLIIACSDSVQLTVYGAKGEDGT